MISTHATRPSPKPTPPTVCGFPNQSANDAPSGRVRIYAIQKAITSFNLSLKYANRGIKMTKPNNMPDKRYPKCNVFAVRSPTAVPNANVAHTVIQ